MANIMDFINFVNGNKMLDKLKKILSLDLTEYFFKAYPAFLLLLTNFVKLVIFATNNNF